MPTIRSVLGLLDKGGERGDARLREVTGEIGKEPESSRVAELGEFALDLSRHGVDATPKGRTSLHTERSGPVEKRLVRDRALSPGRCRLPTAPLA